jgi:drug/metabolite transporter (DMT)-like permease
MRARQGLPDLRRGGKTAIRDVRMSPIHLIWFITLGCFWGLSPSLYKLMGDAGVPISQVITFTGFGVALGMGIIPLLRRGRIMVTKQVAIFTFVCAILMNIPFTLSLLFSRHVAATEYALIASTAPFWNYFVALATRRENASGRRFLAVGVGFVSSAVLIISRGAFTGDISLWVIGCFIVPVVYCAYNWFAARYWPPGGDIMVIGTMESLFCGLIGIPFMLYFAPPWGETALPLNAYWWVLIATAMWTIERIAFFSLIRDRGAVYTIQAIYVSTPAAVLWAIMIFGGGTDVWLWTSLAILMFALYLNNSGRLAKAA